MLAPILKDVHEVIPYLARSFEWSRMEAVAPYAAAPAEDPVHRLGKPDPEALEAAGERAPVLRLDHEVNVIGLNREV